jgi:two-component system sensor histidine kinase/response regulator
LSPSASPNSTIGWPTAEASRATTDLARADHEAAPAVRAKLDPRALDQMRALGRPGAPSVVGKVIRMYLKNTPELLSALRTAMVERNSKGVHQAAHSLKSASANVGATTLAELCRSLEADARAGGCPEPGAGELDALETEFHHVQLELEAELAVSV